MWFGSAWFWFGVVVFGCLAWLGLVGCYCVAFGVVFVLFVVLVWFYV